MQRKVRKADREINERIFGNESGRYIWTDGMEKLTNVGVSLLFWFQFLAQCFLLRFTQEKLCESLGIWKRIIWFENTWKLVNIWMNEMGGWWWGRMSVGALRRWETPGSGEDGALFRPRHRHRTPDRKGVIQVVKHFPWETQAINDSSCMWSQMCYRLFEAETVSGLWQLVGVALWLGSYGTTQRASNNSTYWRRWWEGEWKAEQHYLFRLGFSGKFLGKLQDFWRSVISWFLSPTRKGCKRKGSKEKDISWSVLEGSGAHLSMNMMLWNHGCQFEACFGASKSQDVCNTRGLAAMQAGDTVLLQHTLIAQLSQKMRYWVNSMWEERQKYTENPGGSLLVAKINFGFQFILWFIAGVLTQLPVSWLTNHQVEGSWNMPTCITAPYSLDVSAQVLHSIQSKISSTYSWYSCSSRTSCFCSIFLSVLSVLSFPTCLHALSSTCMHISNLVYLMIGNVIWCGILTGGCIIIKEEERWGSEGVNYYVPTEKERERESERKKRKRKKKTINLLGVIKGRMRNKQRKTLVKQRRGQWNARKEEIKPAKKVARS